jgi:hypothetical protein
VRVLEALLAREAWQRDVEEELLLRPILLLLELLELAERVSELDSS